MTAPLTCEASLSPVALPLKANGLAYRGSISTTFDDLTDLFGQPTFDNGDHARFFLRDAEGNYLMITNRPDRGTSRLSDKHTAKTWRVFTLGRADDVTWLVDYLNDHDTPASYIGATT
jgi:hypothetical protein